MKAMPRYASTGIQIVAGVALVLDGFWILLVRSFMWRDSTVAVPSRVPTVR